MDKFHDLKFLSIFQFFKISRFSANEMLFGQQLRLSSEFQTVMQTAPNNTVHFVSKLQEHFSSLEPS